MQVRFTVGAFQENCYAGDDRTNRAVIVDPARGSGSWKRSTNRSDLEASDYPRSRRPRRGNRIVKQR